MDAGQCEHLAETKPLAAALPAEASGSTLRALLPWIILVTMVSLWGIPAINQVLEQTTPKFEITGLHNQVERVPPVVEVATKEKAIFEFKWLSATGTALLITGWLAGFCLGLGPVTLTRLFLKTLRRTAASLATIAAMLALGFTTRYSGLDATMGLAMASTGWLFPFFSPLLGWLGVALTGSDTASNVLFGNLQKITAERRRDFAGARCRCQQFRRCHGQDDRCSIDRCRRCRHRPTWSRRHDLALRLLPFFSSGRVGWFAGGTTSCAVVLVNQSTVRESEPPTSAVGR